MSVLYVKLLHWYINCVIYIFDEIIQGCGNLCSKYKLPRIKYVKIYKRNKIINKFELHIYLSLYSRLNFIILSNIEKLKTKLLSL